MINCYLGIDIGSISTKGVIIDDDDNIICSSYINTNANPIKAVKVLLQNLEKDFDKTKYVIKNVGTTGSARKLIAKMIGAGTIKNEITAHAIGTIKHHPDVRTIIEIGGQDSKIIIINNGIVVDYSMNTLCAAGTGAFLSSQGKRLGIDVEEFGDIALKSENPTKIAARCTVFAESDLVHKAASGYKVEDIIAGLCESVANNYLNNVAKGKKIEEPILFQGGVSKNNGVKRAFEKLLEKKVLVDDNGHLMGAIGIAIIARKENIDCDFSFELLENDFSTFTRECNGCGNNCEIICIKKDDVLIDSWGNRCEKGTVKKA